MIDFSQSKIKHLIIHEIGNKLRDEKLFLSLELQNINEDLEDTLLYYFLKSFLSNQELFQFTHSSNLNLNEVYSYTANLFRENNETSFIENSQNIAKHLYEHTLHPKITKGELIIVELENILYNHESIKLIGVFKSEHKDTFLKVVKDTNSIGIKDDKGINTSKIEKGCLVLNYNQESGFVVLNIDNH
ncbi:MAG: nucleoid-associated protein, partial [Campylobacterales bacterium]|nr:nucleoid-associated protein [Campylobacterales bacterium]